MSRQTHKTQDNTLQTIYDATGVSVKMMQDALTSHQGFSIKIKKKVSLIIDPHKETTSPTDVIFDGEPGQFITCHSNNRGCNWSISNTASAKVFDDRKASTAQTIMINLSNGAYEIIQQPDGNVGIVEKKLIDPRTCAPTFPFPSPNKHSGNDPSGVSTDIGKAAGAAFILLLLFTLLYKAYQRTQGTAASTEKELPTERFRERRKTPSSGGQKSTGPLEDKGKGNVTSSATKVITNYERPKPIPRHQQLNTMFSEHSNLILKIYRNISDVQVKGLYTDLFAIENNEITKTLNSKAEVHSFSQNFKNIYQNPNLNGKAKEDLQTLATRLNIQGLDRNRGK